MSARPCSLPTALVALMAVLGSAMPAGAVEGAATLAGTAEVVDGDTLDLTAGTTTTKVRLFGIDAPEGGQTCLDGSGRSWACGGAARTALEGIARGRRVTCQGRVLDDYGRLLAVCTAGGGREINAALVRQGLAWAFTRYSDAYVAAEREARAGRRGVFAAQNTPPWEYRAQRWKGATRTAGADRACSCPIKGNISGSSERIHHLPWQATYERTRIDERAGERWFCDEREAERAGWRRAR